MVRSRVTLCSTIPNSENEEAVSENPELEDNRSQQHAA